LLNRLFQDTPAKRREKLVGHGEVARLVAVEMGLGAALIESLNFASSVAMVREPPAWRVVSAFRWSPG